MHFLKIGLLFSASTFSKLLAGLVVVKIIAVYVGADGLGRLGQFMSLMSMITIMAGGGISSGVIKYVAQYREDGPALRASLGAASLLAIVASVLFGAVLFGAANAISRWLFDSTEYGNVIRVLALAQVVIALVNLLVGLVNGHQRVQAFAVINILGVLAGALGVAGGCVIWGIEGAMYGLIWMPAANILFLLPWYFFVFKGKVADLAPTWNREKIGQYLKYSLMLLVSVCTMQLAQVIVRQVIESNHSWVEVGYWQAVSKISDAYLQFITVVLANYYMPRLAALKLRSEVRSEVRSVYKIAMPVLATLSVGVFLARDLIIVILFSRDFLPMQEFFLWQLMGDAFKIAAYIGAYVAVARARTTVYIAAEIFQAGMLVMLAYLLIGKFGAVGASYAYCANYMLYFVVVQVALRLYLRKGGAA